MKGASHSTQLRSFGPSLSLSLLRSTIMFFFFPRSPLYFRVSAQPARVLASAYTQFACIVIH